MLIGGPTPTKEEFEAGGYLHHELQKRIIGLFDVAYTNESGLSELVENAADALKDLDIIKEKNVMNRFLQELVKSDGAASYGEESVRKNLELGAVDTLILSEKLRRARLRLACPNDDYAEERTVSIEPGKHIRDLDLGTCPHDGAPLYITEETDIIDELTTLADQSSTTVKIISDDFEEGSMLYSAFGGIAAILRYRTGY